MSVNHYVDATRIWRVGTPGQRAQWLRKHEPGVTNEIAWLEGRPQTFPLSGGGHREYAPEPVPSICWDTFGWLSPRLTDSEFASVMAYEFGFERFHQLDRSIWRSSPKEDAEGVVGLLWAIEAFEKNAV